MTGTAYAISRETWIRPQGDVWACFELNGVDAPHLVAIKSTGRGIAWLDADRANRFLMPFRIDAEPDAVAEDEDLFSISGVQV